MPEICSELPDYDPYNPLPLRADQGLERYSSAESFFMAANPEAYVSNSVLMSLRDRGLLVMYKYSECENFDPIVPFLAMTYFDRCFSREHFAPKLMGDIFLHDVELLALCCLTLAWKMRYKTFTVRKLQAEQPDLRVVTRMQFETMELHILETLEWRLHGVTPLCFLQYFEPDPTWVSRRKTISENIIHSIIAPVFTTHKPSVIAASALIDNASGSDPHLILVLEKISKQTAHATEQELKSAPESDLAESKQVETIGEPQNAGINSQNAADQVKEKALETIEDMQLNFPLMWGYGAAYVENFAVFRYFEPKPAQEAPEQVQGDLEQNQGQG
ncbi:Cyclin [Parasponia andersonii]|uniref:B-like cyclin n=1 Tax=Parasponia andersonii TaxID=3476 RepID=A0A2P5AP72_PARAD|nr:Cyclin [Parasponia andersonii]